MHVFKICFFVLALGFSFLVNAQEKPDANFEQINPVKVFPNPAVEYLTVKFETPQARKASLVLHNIIGSEVETDAEVVDDYEVKIKVKDLNPGLYLLLVHNKESGFKGAYKILKK